jgi:hypothetical protein
MSHARRVDDERLTKSLHFQVKDAGKGLVEAVFSTFNVKDFDDDLTLPGAFEDGAPVTISAYGHKSWAGVMPVGKGAIRAETGRAVLDGQFFLQTAAGKETFEVVKAMGQDQQWSYGYDVLETGTLSEEMRQKGVSRVLQKLKVYEVSPVLVGAGVGTTTLSMKAATDPCATCDHAMSAHAKNADGGAGACTTDGCSCTMFMTAPDPMKAMREVSTRARQEFARFQKTRARLVAIGRW